MAAIKIFPVLVLSVFLFTKDLFAQQPMNTNEPLDKKQQSIIPISAFTAKGDAAGLQKALSEGLDAGLTVNEIKEVLIQLYAYAGFPRSLNALNTFMAVLKERKAQGMNDPVGKEPSPLPTDKSRLQLGTELQTRLVGRPVGGEVYQFAPAIDQFLKEHLFGDIFGRDNLDWKTREIATISALAALGGAESQLRSHFNVGLHTGLTEAQLKSIAAVLQAKVGNKEGNTAHEVLGLVLTKSDNTVALKNSLVDEGDNANTIFPKGTRIANGNFTGNAWLHVLVNSDTTFNTSVGNVTFEKGARTNWHYHPGGQVLLITSGKGRYQERGKAIRELRKGDVITCAPNTMHWHGAAPDSELSHIAIGTNLGKGAVVWLEPVSDEEYNKQ